MGYTTFEIDGLEVKTAGNACQVRFALRNAGSRAGKAVPQIYVRYPPDAGEPGAQLKGFDAVRLEAGERRELTIEVAADDLMIFDEESDSRILPAGEYEVRAGFSSRDIRATAVVYLRQKSGR
jgi:beta-glucosidase